MSYHRHTEDERTRLIDSMVEAKFRTKRTWEEIADNHNISRATQFRWRTTTEWRDTESRWRRIIREEARSRVTGIADEAIVVMQNLMHDTNVSPFTRYSCAAKLADLVGIENEIEEEKLDHQKDVLDFFAKIKKQPVESGVTQTNILAAEVKAGGFMPEVIVEANKQMADEVDAEFREVYNTDSPMEDSPLVYGETNEADDRDQEELGEGIATG